MRDPLPQAEFDWIFARVPRLTVELVITVGTRSVLLALRDFGPCKGLWHLPGGTVRFGEPLIDAAKRVARDELGVRVKVGEMLGYIEYPSHYNQGLDCPVGLAFLTVVTGGLPELCDLRSECAWFAVLPDNMHGEQKEFLAQHLHGLTASRTSDAPPIQ
jgi:ADP-ribose pyrophosphatase YjhB (NUDIX family)